MVYTDGSEVMIDGIILPGLCKSMEISTAAEIEEQEVQGSTAKPKQATGYEDGKVNLELILIDSEDFTKKDKLQVIQNLFRKKGQDIPAVHSIVNEHIAQRNITQVLLKSLTTKETNSKEEMTVTLELWEYVPMTISINAAQGAGETNYAEELNTDYQGYLESRGTAPKQSDKTSQSPVADALRNIVNYASAIRGG